MPFPMGLLGQKNWTFRASPMRKDPRPTSPAIWQEPDLRLPRIFNPRLRGQASLTSHGWPATWSTLQLTPALPDLMTALSRRTAPVIQPFSAGQAGGRIQVPAIYVPVRK